MGMNAGRAQRRRTASCHARLRCSQRATRKNPSRFCRAGPGSKNEAVGTGEGTAFGSSRWRCGDWHAVALDRCAAKNKGTRRRAPSRTGPGCCAVCRCHPSLAGTICKCRFAYRWHRSRGHRWRPSVLTLKRRHAPLSRCCSKTSDSRFARGWLQRGAACLLQFLHLAAVVCSDCMPFGTARPTN